MSGVYDEIRNLVNFVPAGVPEQYAACPTKENATETRFLSNYTARRFVNARSALTCITNKPVSLIAVQVENFF